MPDESHLAQLLGPFGPKRPLAELVVDLNRLYHAVEAESYDHSHPEIFAQLPELWRSMIEQARPILPSEPLTVVDYGCGTGFAASRVVAELGPERIAELICYDPSPEMLARCRERFRSAAMPVRFCTTEAEWGADRVARIDVLLTNSLLHHLPDPVAMARGLRARMGDQAVWLAGHEPSVRFYRNPECVDLWQRFERRRRWRRYLSPSAYWEVGKRVLGVGAEPASVAARQAYAKGWFQVRPSPAAIGRVVDLHVAASPAEVAAGRGLDVERLATDLTGAWSLVWTKSYSYLGNVAEAHASATWQRACAELARRHPRDGANFCAVWRGA